MHLIQYNILSVLPTRIEQMNLIHYLDLIQFSCHTIVEIEFDSCATHKQGLKPQPNDHNISMEHITTLLAQHF